MCVLSTCHHHTADSHDDTVFISGSVFFGSAVCLPRDVADGCDEEQVPSAREEVPQEGIHA
jgi:hypothetical protein